MRVMGQIGTILRIFPFFILKTLSDLDNIPLQCKKSNSSAYVL